MNRYPLQRLKALSLIAIVLMLGACSVPKIAEQKASFNFPNGFQAANKNTNLDSLKRKNLHYKNFINDAFLVSLIDSALKHNQELGMINQELIILQNEVRSRKGEYLPFVNFGALAGVERASRNTLRGATEEQVPIRRNLANPDPLGNTQLAFVASWEVDIWHRLRNAKKAAFKRYLSSVEGKNFVSNKLIAELLTSYFEWQALKAELEVVDSNIVIQQKTLDIINTQKQFARANSLIVNRFYAQLQNTQSTKFDILQNITIVENRIRFLTGDTKLNLNFPAQKQLTDSTINSVAKSFPWALLNNRPDLQQSILEIQSRNLEVKVARALFLPSLSVDAVVGSQAFQPSRLARLPESVIYGLGAGLLGPLVNRNGIKANFNSSVARERSAIINYEQKALNAYLEVKNQLAEIENRKQALAYKESEVRVLNEAVQAANSLYMNARADYTEVLLTQRDALNAQFEYIELKKLQLLANVGLFHALGGGL